MTTPQQTALLAFSARIQAGALLPADIDLLTSVLAEIIPTWGFDGTGAPPDARGVITSDEGNARTWFAALYAVAEGIPVVSTQAVWFIDPVNGKPTNDGLTAATAVDSWATVASRYTGGIPGILPFLNPSGGTLTINVLNSTPVSDPAAVLLNANYGGSVAVNVVGAAQAASHTGTMTTVSAFARTSAGGKIAMTDAGVADFHPFTPSLLVDTTTGGVGWLAEPKSGASATANLSPAYTAQTVGGFPVQSPVAYAATNAYQLIPLISVYLGSLITVNAEPFGGTGNFTQLSFFRIRTTAAISGDVTFITSKTDCTVAYQECQIDSAPVATGQCVVIAANCGNTSPFSSYQGLDSGACEAFAGGFEYAGVIANEGGTVVLDQDNAAFLDTGRGHNVTQNGNLFIGQHGNFETGGGGEMIAVEGGNLIFTPEFATAVIYGTSGGNFCVITYNSGQQLSRGSMRYPNGFAVATFQVNHATIAMPSTPFSPNLSTGVYVGPTTATAANLDAPGPVAGTALAGIATDLKMGCIIVGA